MREPSPRSSRMAIAGGLVALIAIGGGGFMLGRATSAGDEGRPLVEPSPTAAPTPVAITLPDQILRRPDLIALGAIAADATASGTALPKGAGSMAGRRFELVLPFGCDGEAAPGSDAALQWRHDEAAGALRIRATPVTWPTADWLQKPGSEIEGLEGFWIARPWSSGEACPASPAVSAAPDADPVTLPGQTLGVVQLITSATPRQLRRGERPYDVVLRRDADPAAFPKGVTLRLSGRIGRFPDGRPVRCRQPGGGEQRPICLISVEIQEVALDDPARAQVLATWQATAQPGERGG